MRILLLVIALMSTQVLAQTSNKTTIQRVEVTDAFFTIYADGGDFGKQSCDSGNPIAFYPEDFPNNYNAMLSTALAAFAAERPVTMWLVGCRPSPWSGTLPKPSSLVIHK